jgi:hypothetical protein
MRLNTLFLMLCTACAATAQYGPVRGTTSDTAYTEQVYTTLAIGLMLRDTTTDGSYPAFKDVPRLAHVAGRLDSLSKTWSVGCDDISVSGETHGPMNVVRLTVCRERQPPHDQLILYYEPADTSATVVRMDVASFGSALYRTPSEQTEFAFPTGKDPHLGRILLLNIGVGLARSWYGIQQR